MRNIIDVIFRYPNSLRLKRKIRTADIYRIISIFTREVLDSHFLKVAQSQSLLESVLADKSMYE